VLITVVRSDELAFDGAAKLAAAGAFHALIFDFRNFAEVDLVVGQGRKFRLLIDCQRREFIEVNPIFQEFRRCRFRDFAKNRRAA
jgi:hypothetical protein